MTWPLLTSWLDCTSPMLLLRARHPLAPRHPPRAGTPGIGKGGGLGERELTPSTWRWWALFLFVLLGMAQNIAWIVFSTIIDDAREYYSFTDSQVNRLVEIST